MTDKPPQTTTKNCAVCNKTLRRKKLDNNFDWFLRKYCGNACAIKAKSERMFSSKWRQQPR